MNYLAAELRGLNPKVQGERLLSCGQPSQQSCGELNPQRLKISREVVNLCQNHVIGSKVDRVYLLDDYADEKREAWNKLGDRLEAILSASNVVSLKSA